MPYDSEDPPPPLITQQLIEHCAHKRWGLVIGSDINSHNQIWGCEDNNRRGEHLLEYILTTNLQIINRGNTPTFSNIQRKTVIDITLANIELTERIKHWKVIENVTDSDHNLITYEFQIETAQETEDSET